MAPMTVVLKVRLLVGSSVCETVVKTAVLLDTMMVALSVVQMDISKAEQMVVGLARQSVVYWVEY